MNRLIVTHFVKKFNTRYCHHDGGINKMALLIEAQKKREEKLQHEVQELLSRPYTTEGWSGSHLEKMILEGGSNKDDDIFLL